MIAKELVAAKPGQLYDGQSAFCVYLNDDVERDMIIIIMFFRMRIFPDDAANSVLCDDCAHLVDFQSLPVDVGRWGLIGATFD